MVNLFQAKDAISLLHEINDFQRVDNRWKLVSVTVDIEATYPYKAWLEDKE